MGLVKGLVYILLDLSEFLRVGQAQVLCISLYPKLSTKRSYLVKQAAHSSVDHPVERLKRKWGFGCPVSFCCNMFFIYRNLSYLFAFSFINILTISHNAVSYLGSITSDCGNAVVLQQNALRGIFHEPCYNHIISKLTLLRGFTVYRLCLMLFFIIFILVNLAFSQSLVVCGYDMI